jgi:transglutaminase-like putative cysteine protease
MNALRIAVRAQAATFSARRTIRGRLTKLQRESITMSLVGVEKGSGVLVIESESPTPLDVPGAAFSEMIAEINRPQNLPAHTGMQRAVLALESLFRRESDAEVEEVEFIDKHGNVARVDFQTMSRIRSTFEDQARDDGVETAALTGRLLELDLARQSFRVHTAGDEVETIGYTDIMEQVVRDALNAFVVATVATNAGHQDLLSLEIIENVPESRFSERRSLDSIVNEQGISPLQDLDALAMPDLIAVPYDEFESFVKALRHKEP